MRKVPIIFSEKFLEYQHEFLADTPDRLQAIVAEIVMSPFWDSVEWIEPTKRDSHQCIVQCHSCEYLSYLEGINQTGGSVDIDTPVPQGFLDFAFLSVTAWLDGVDIALKQNSPVWVLARPPGHHAKRNYGGGYCIFSNAAIAAHYALEQLGINRVAILDWDVHHGNGTQELAQDNPNLAYCSIHQEGLYPKTGFAFEQGKFSNVLNIPIGAGSDFLAYQIAFETEILPFLKSFAPDLMIVSAGFDAHENEAISGIKLKSKDFYYLTEYSLSITPKVVFGLEGGYNCSTVGQSVLEAIKTCCFHSVKSKTVQQFVGKQKLFLK